MNELNIIHNMDCIAGLQLLESESVNCCVTSPPYYNLRNYNCDGQIGLEETPELFITRLVEVFREVKRVLRNDGTLWVVIADSYAGSGKNAGNSKPHMKATKGLEYLGDTLPKHKITNVKHKDLIGIPWMLAFALRADGWFLRQDIIWAKGNPMPESVKDRCTKSHETIFLLSKSKKYYFDAEAISEPVAKSTVKRMSQDIENQKGSERVPGKTNGNMKAVAPRYGGNKYTANPDEFSRTKSGNMYDLRDRRNKRDVWQINTSPQKDLHFATFPPKLIEPCILAGCPAGGTVLDPFIGSGTTGMVAKAYGRNYIGIDLNGDYIKIAEKRIGI